MVFTPSLSKGQYCARSWKAKYLSGSKPMDSCLLIFRSPNLLSGVFDGVDYYEDKTRRHYVGGSSESASG